MSSPPPISYDVTSLPSYDFFGYWPSLALAATALSLFLVAALVFGVHTYLAKNPLGHHMHFVTTTGLTEAAGYIAIVWLIENSGSTNIYPAYVTSQVFIILSPNLLQAANYKTVAEIIKIYSMDEGKKFLKAKYITVGFILADVFALCIQAVGIAIWASSKGSGTPDPDKISLGSWITVVGLGVQLFSFACFIVVAVWVHRSPRNLLRGSPKKKLFFGLYSTIALVTLRNIYRFIEFLQDATLSWPYSPDTYVLSEQQVLFYCLDTLPILLCFVFYLLFNPAYLLPNKPVDDITVEGSVLVDDVELAGDKTIVKDDSSPKVDGV